MSRVLKKTVQQGRSDLSLTKGWLGWSQLRASNEGLRRPRVARAQGPSQYPALFFSILLEIQIEELIVFGREVQAGPVAGETRNDATMFLAEPG